MKWDRNMNVAVVRSHFKALIENPDTYSKSLHKNFKETYPGLDVAAQRVLDRAHAVFGGACASALGAGGLRGSTALGFHRRGGCCWGGGGHPVCRAGWLWSSWSAVV